MIDVRILVMVLSLAPVNLACHATSTAAATTTAVSPSDDIAVGPPGSEGDLRFRGAFRANAGTAATSELADRWLTLTVQTQARDGSWWALGAGGQLRSGEVLVAEVELERPAHIYVINVSASGKAVLLYPDRAYERDALLGRGTHRLPPARSEYPYIKLDSEVGTEHLIVVATPQPVANVDHKLGAIVEKLRRGESPTLTQHRASRAVAPSRKERIEGGKKPPSGRPGAGAALTRAESDIVMSEANAGVTPEMRTRGANRSRAEGAAVDATAGSDGVAIIPFQFEHI